MDTEHTGIAIIGGGPAGLTAALYAARGRAKTTVFERGIPGGQIVTTDRIENYPGFPEGLSGAELGDLMARQAEIHGAIIKGFNPVEAIEAADGHFTVVSEEGVFLADAVILATGTTPRKLGIPGEAEFTGRGVSWCATCDGALYRDKEVCVIGGGDAAVEEAMFLTRFASQVHLIHRRDALRATKCLQERAFLNDKIKIHWNRVVTEVIGANDKVSAVRLASTSGEPEEILPLAGVFIFAGIIPASELVENIVELGGMGYVSADVYGKTSVPGLFAAGDVASFGLKQVITAASKGAQAAFEALKYLDEDTATRSK
ncbi:MAG: thioredoxin-disulfide reductase [Coriobacteriia bacterium]|nr:thioredoxin-disulfide reductase [Coriobacteriia bacterium]